MSGFPAAGDPATAAAIAGLQSQVDQLGQLVAAATQQIAAAATFFGSTDLITPSMRSRGDFYLDNGAGQLLGLPPAIWTNPASLTTWLAQGSETGPLTITTAALPNATQNVAYTAPIAVIGGTTPYVFSAMGLPTSLTIDAATGVVSGIPTGTGTSNVTISVTDLIGATQSVVLGLVVSAIGTPFTFALPAFAHGAPNAPYTPVNLAADAAGGTLPYTFIASGLPPGITVSTAGLLSGTPTLRGSYHITVTATDSAGSPSSVTDTAQFVIDPYLSITNTTNPPSGRESSPYAQYNFTATGGNGQYQWGVLSGALPPGMTLTNYLNAGVLGGQPNAATAGTYNFTLIVTDSSSPQQFDAQAYTLRITATGAVLAFTPPATLPAGTAGTPYSQNLVGSASGGTPPYTFSAVSGFPAWLAISAAGVLSGQPGYTDSGTSSLVIRCTDSAGSPAHVDASCRLTIGGGPRVFDIGPYLSTDYNLATGNGTYAASSAAVVPANVAAAIRSLDASARTTGGVLVNRQAAGVLAVGNAAGAAAWNAALVTLNYLDVDLDGTTPGTFKAEVTLAPRQPSSTPGGHCNAVSFLVQNRIGGRVELFYNGNAKNQYTQAANNANGCYYHGVRLLRCGSMTGNIRSRNIRCITNASGRLIPNPNTGQSDIGAETMLVQDLWGLGGHNLDGSVFTDDGSDVAGYTSATQPNEGAGYPGEGWVTNYVQAGSPLNTYRIHNGYRTRQVVGFFCGGDANVYFDAAGSFHDYHYDFINCEAGDPTGSSVNTDATGNLYFGVIGGTQIAISSPNPSYGDIVVNGNAPASVGNHGSVTIDCAIQSTNPKDHLFLSQHAWRRVTLNNSHVDSPSTSGVHFAQNAAEWANALFMAGCAIHVVAPALATRGGALAAGHGTWATF